MTAEEAELNLVQPEELVVKVHPVVLFSICDSFMRRNEGQERVIGTLLGRVSRGSKVVEVKSCFAVPFQEARDQVQLDISYQRTMAELQRTVTANEVVVGWYSTEGGFASADVLIQEFFDDETLDGPCIHLVVDTSLQHAQMAIRAYTAQALVIGGGSVATHFTEIPIEYRNMDIERVGASLLNRSAVDDIPTDAESFGTAIQKFSEVIEKVSTYVDDVVAGTLVPDSKIGRYLAEIIAAIPNLEPEVLERLFNDNMQDVLLVSYLTNLTATQIALADKIGTPMEQGWS